MALRAEMRDRALGVECPWCGSPVGERCAIKAGVHMQRVHAAMGTEPETPGGLASRAFSRNGARVEKNWAFF